MKKLFYLLLICLLCPMSMMAKEHMSHRFSGFWTLNDADQHFGGEMKIYNCNDTECDFKLQSWYDLHICDTEGKLALISAESATYKSQDPRFDTEQGKDYFVTVGISFELLPNGSLNLKYLNSDSHGAFCGMSATIEGTWIRQQD